MKGSIVALLILLLLSAGCSPASSPPVTAPTNQLATNPTADPLSSKPNSTTPNSTTPNSTASNSDAPNSATSKPATKANDSSSSAAQQVTGSVKQENKAQFYVDKVYNIRSTDPNFKGKVALLTFDDAPYGNTTKQILDILDQYHAKAIFFINGHLAEPRQDVIKEIVARGHIIGNHTWWHDNLKKMTPEKTKEEIVSVSKLIEQITGSKPVYFRPPFGINSDLSKKIIKDEGMQTMNWSVGSEDWVYTKPDQSDIVYKKVMEQMHNGANILFHDKAVTVKALGPILKKLQEDGYTFVLPTEVRP